MVVLKGTPGEGRTGDRDVIDNGLSSFSSPSPFLAVIATFAHAGGRKDFSHAEGLSTRY